MGDYSVLIEYYPGKINEIHIYSGTENKPRSSLLILSSENIILPKRVSSVSENTLIQRYDTIEMDKNRFNSSLHQILFYLDTEGWNKLFNEDIKDQNKFKKEFKSDEKKPVYEEIPTYRLKQEEKKGFANILLQPTRNERQKSLTNFLLNYRNTANEILHILLGTNIELSGAIIREFGRQNIENIKIRDFCRDNLDNDNRGISRLSFYYLFQFDRGFILNSTFYSELEYETNKLEDFTLSSIWYQYNKLIEGDQLENSQLFMGFILLSQRYYSLLKNLVNQIFDANWLKKKFAKPLRRALMPLLKFVEITHDYRLLAVITVISLQGNKYLIKDNQLHRNIGPIGMEMKYIHRRINSLIEIWILNDQRDILEKYLKELLILHPPTDVSKDIEVNQELIDFWLNEHPIIKNHKSITNKIFNDNEFQTKLLIHLGKFEHQILKQLLLSKLDKKKVKEQLKEFSPEEIFYASKLGIKAKIDHSKISQPLSLSIYKPSLKQIEEMILFAIDHPIAIKIEIFTSYINKIMEIRDYDLANLKKYLTKINDAGISTKHYLDQLLEILLPHSKGEDSTQGIINIILEIIIPWSKFAGNPSEDASYKIDALKIIFKNQIDEFDMENWQPLAVESIITVYQLADGNIPSFVEGNIGYAFSKPDWDQMARHYLAMGIERPKREAIKNSQLKRIPNQLTRDILGQIALVNQTITYCERAGFTKGFENLIINNIYKRGWNVERRLEQTLASYFGIVSSRLRSYFAAYLVIEQGEVDDDILQLARDVENYQLRDKIIRSLERYGTPSMWLTLGESYHEDMKSRALSQIKETRMSATERSNLTYQLLQSTEIELRDLGKKWLENQGIHKEHLPHLYYNPYVDCWSHILDYIQSHKIDHIDEYDEILADFIIRVLLEPSVKKKVRKKAIEVVSFISDINTKSEISELFKELAKSSIKTRSSEAIHAYTKLGGDES